LEFLRASDFRKFVSPGLFECIQSEEVKNAMKCARTKLKDAFKVPKKYYAEFISSDEAEPNMTQGGQTLQSEIFPYLNVIGNVAEVDYALSRKCYW
jgi:hypothetical protein